MWHNQKTDEHLYDFEKDECFDEPKLWVSWVWIIVAVFLLGVLVGMLIV
jgi:hypothetical protein